MIRKILSATTVALIFALLFSGPARAGNLPPMGIPLTTTIIVSKPAPGQTFGDQKVITFSVDGKPYKFVLKDGYVDSVKYVWPDSWEYVRFHQPNLIVQGSNADQIAKIQPGETVDENDLPPGPSPTPRPSLTLPPVASPSPGATSAVVTAGPRGGNGVALTFDMGGRLDPALDIVGWLVDHGVAASVFPTGKTASTTTIGRQVMATVAAHPDLFTIGNHTWDHPDLTTLDASAVAKELVDTETVVVDLTGRSTRPFFRPPYGTQDLATRQTAGELGWAYTVLWDVDTIDWKPMSDGGPTADDIVARVLSRAKGGSIVLMHLGGYETLAALPRIVDGLRARGLEPVTLDQLFGR